MNSPLSSASPACFRIQVLKIALLLVAYFIISPSQADETRPDKGAPTTIALDHVFDWWRSGTPVASTPSVLMGLGVYDPRSRTSLDTLWICIPPFLPEDINARLKGTDQLTLRIFGISSDGGKRFEVSGKFQDLEPGWRKLGINWKQFNEMKPDKLAKIPRWSFAFHAALERKGVPDPVLLPIYALDVPKASPDEHILTKPLQVHLSVSSGKKPYLSWQGKELSDGACMNLNHGLPYDLRASTTALNYRCKIEAPPSGPGWIVKVKGADRRYQPWAAVTACTAPKENEPR